MADKGSPSPTVPAPRANPLLLGHERTEAEVARWVENGRLGQALLICGPRGIGKATWAFRIARTLLGLPVGAAGQGAQGSPLPAAATVFGSEPSAETEDQTFRWVAASAHPDLLTVERRFDEKRGRPLNEIVVDDVRRIGAFLAASPAQGGWRVVVVDAADEMNRNAANALLKVLEEPGARSLVILVAHQPGLMPATVRSRCRRIVLQPLPADVLDRLIACYRPDISPADRVLLARLAEGSIGRALELADTGALAAYRSLGIMLAALADGDDRPLLAYAADPPAGGDAESYRTISHLLLWWLRALVRMSATGAHGSGDLLLPGLADEDQAVVRRLAAAAPLDRWLKVWDKTGHLTTQGAAGNLDRKQTLSTVFLNVRSELRQLSS
jgi:DNA polymerase-3 subunit delta'